MVRVARPGFSSGGKAPAGRKEIAADALRRDFRSAGMPAGYLAGAAAPPGALSMTIGFWAEVSAPAPLFRM